MNVHTVKLRIVGAIFKTCMFTTGGLKTPRHARHMGGSHEQYKRKLKAANVPFGPPVVTFEGPNDFSSGCYLTPS